MPMQPRPWAETSSPWLPSFLLSIECLLVSSDLLFDEGEVLLHLRQPSHDRGTMLLEQRQPVALVSFAVTHELGVAADALNRHAGGAQALQGLDPSQVPLVVATVA